MALYKEKTLEDGSVGNYWKVISAIIDRSNDTMELIVHLYLNQNARDSDKSFMRVCRYPLQNITILELESADNPIELAYIKLKELSEFSGATDV